jgi:2-C-methyl-D-erythritol 4-phosphate cytidylyltransferase
MNTAMALQTEDQLALIIAAAGSSQRFGQGNKLLQDLRGLPVFCHTVRNFLSAISPGACLLITPAAEQSTFAQQLQAHLPALSARVQCLPGGATRAASVLAGLQAVPESCEYIAIQDAARPFSSAELLLRCLASARQYGSGVAAHRLTDTVKVVQGDHLVSHTLDRRQLWGTETPQVFSRALLLQAYRAAAAQDLGATDEAQLLENSGQPVHLVENTCPNPKITLAGDLKFYNY